MMELAPERRRAGAGGQPGICIGHGLRILTAWRGEDDEKTFSSAAAFYLFALRLQ
jgi:hypothetical protein